MNFDARLLKHMDKLLVLVTLGLITFGIIAVSSAAAGYIGADRASSFVNKQIIAAGIGLFLLAVILVFDYTEFGRMTWLLYGLNVAMLAAVVLMGKLQNGAQSWIAIGPLQIQPSEFGKVLFIMTFGHHLSKIEHLKTIWDLVIPALHVLPLVVLLMLQPDLGTTLVFIVITAAMVYMAGFPGWKIALMGGGPIAAVGTYLWAHLTFKIPMWPLQDHMVERLVVFVRPEADPEGAGYHVMQSKIAIGGGGFWGKGYFRGTQNQLGFLPEQHTDFIFAVIAEEFGFIGGLALILLFLLLLWRIMITAAHAKDTYGTLIATGVAAMIGFHVLENIGMTLGVMPVTGIPLPFISYGGSSMMANMLAIGLVLNVGMRRQKIMF